MKKLTKILLTATVLMVAVFLCCLVQSTAVAFADTDTAVEQSEETAQKEGVAATINDNNTALIDWFTDNKTAIISTIGAVLSAAIIALLKALFSRVSVNAVSNISLNDELKKQSSKIADSVSKVDGFKDVIASIAATVDTVKASLAEKDNVTTIAIKNLAEMLHSAYLHSNLSEDVKSSIEGFYNKVTSADQIDYEKKIAELTNTISTLTEQLSGLKK